jgi:hypothetical protein
VRLSSAGDDGGPAGSRPDTFDVGHRLSTVDDVIGTVIGPLPIAMLMLLLWVGFRSRERHDN